MFKLGEHFPFTRSDNKAKLRACISEQTKWSVQGGRGWGVSTPKVSYVAMCKYPFRIYALGLSAAHLCMCFPYDVK
jgi:hypothetical protein